MEKPVFPSPEKQKEEMNDTSLERQIFEQSSSVVIRPEDRNTEGQLLTFPEGPISKLEEREWKMVRTEAFKEWFSESLVVDENGEPLVLYHGSSNDFDTFELTKVGARSAENKDSGYFGTGFYFTPSKELARRYGPILYKSFLRIENIQTFSEKDGNVRFNEIPLPENIREDVLRLYKPLQAEKLQQLQEEEGRARANWSYVSSWNGSDTFEDILSDVIESPIRSRLRWCSWV